MARTIDDQPSIQEARCSGVAAIDGDPTPRYTVDKFLVDLAGTVVARRLLVRCHSGSQVSVVQPTGTSRDVDQIRSRAYSGLCGQLHAEDMNAYGEGRRRSSPCGHDQLTDPSNPVAPLVAFEPTRHSGIAHWQAASGEGFGIRAATVADCPRRSPYRVPATSRHSGD